MAVIGRGELLVGISVSGLAGVGALALWSAIRGGRGVAHFRDEIVTEARRRIARRWVAISEKTVLRVCHRLRG